MFRYNGEAVIRGAIVNDNTFECGIILLADGIDRGSDEFSVISVYDYD
jgi:hypothetical protein